MINMLNTKRKGMPSDDPTGSIAKKIGEKGADIGKHTSEDSSQTVNFSSKDRMGAMIENDPWLIRNGLIRNVPLILKKWTLDANIVKEHVCNIHVWVKFHEIPVNVLTEDGLSAITTKLDTPMMLDSYTSTMCTNSLRRSSYAKVMVELRVNVELKDTLVNGASSSDKKKRAGLTRQEVRTSNPFDSLNTVENDDELGTNRENSKLAMKGANSYMVSSVHRTSYDAFGSPNTTLLATSINDIKRKMLDGKLVLVDDDGKPLKKLIYLRRIVIVK
ncbi:alpha/beta hydrolases superfamily protein [Tanacetum coccineum]|uniref:Alpha/beta hydrolases superfamily protein n=1 Tax=Tanacetum coccineum TaxID=301880 RepID=A0ABQ5IXA0_9ASTR